MNQLSSRPPAPRVPGFAGRKDGSSLVLVMIFALSIIVVAASVTNRAIVENRINNDHILFHKARNIADAMVQYGAAEVRRRFLVSPSLPAPEFIDRPINVPASAITWWSNAKWGWDKVNLVSAYKPMMASGPTASSGSLIHAGLIRPQRRVFINPNDPQNEFDPLKGKYTYIRDVAVMGRGWITTPNPQTPYISAWAMQHIHMRDAPLFSHAVFYNMELEYHPGPQMEMSGPVHTNGNLYLSAANTSADFGLRFTDVVTATGQALHGHPTNPLNQKGKIKFASGRVLTDGSREFLEFFWPTGTDIRGNPTQAAGDSARSVSSNYLDHNRTDWRELSSQRFAGYLMDQAHGVPRLNPVAIDDYVMVTDRGDDPTGDKGKNYAYALIEPIIPQSHPDAKKDIARNEQFAYRAGVIFRVEMADPADVDNESNYSVRALRIKRDGVGDPVLDPTGDVQYEEVTVPPGVIGQLNWGDYYQDWQTASAGISGFDPATGTHPGANIVPRISADGRPSVFREEIWDIDPRGAGWGKSGVLDSDADGKPDVNSGKFVGTPGNDSNGTGSSHNFNPQPVVVGGLHDSRQGFTTANPSNDVKLQGESLIDPLDHASDELGRVNTFTIDVDRLRQVVDNTYDGPGGAYTPWNTAGGTAVGGVTSTDFDPARDWNGVVYVQFPTVLNPDGGAFDNGRTTGRDDKVARINQRRLALQIINGAVPVSSAAADSNNSTPTYKSAVPRPTQGNAIRGLTLATNAAAYVVGNFNADGVGTGLGTGTSQKLDGSTGNHVTGAKGNTTRDPGGADSEPPAAIVADSVMILSEYWKRPNRGHADIKRNNSSDTQKQIWLPNSMRSMMTTAYRKTPNTEVSAAIMTGLVTSSRIDQQARSGGNHNFPRFLEQWGSTLTLRTSMVALFESESHRKPFLESKISQWYNPPTRNWGYNENFKHGYYPPGTPNVRNFRRIAYEEIGSQQEYDAMLAKIRTN